jgi:dipeptidyl aminopeptidase/acylaminoacyl peptidase
VKYWRQHIGDPGSAAVSAVSPARHIEPVRAAVMLMHGKDDTVVPFEQSEIMAKALQKQGKAYELVRLDGEDHWLSRSDTRTRMLQELERFLGEHLGRTGR